MHVIVGLGNPGRKYEGTRHNTGFRCIDALAEKYHIPVLEVKHKALVGRGVIEGEKVILVKPQTFMNLSGESVAEVVNFYKVNPETELIVICDDIYLDTGVIRIRKKGSAGGHNGMKNIIVHLGSETFQRIRVGVGEKPEKYDLADYVLGHFTGEDEKVLSETAERITEAVPLMIKGRTDEAMNRFN